MEDSPSLGNPQSQTVDRIQKIWQKAFNAFENKEYKHAAEHLKIAQTIAIQSNDSEKARILTATRQLCLAEYELKIEIEHQQKMLDKSLRREKNIRNQLQVILKSFSQSSSSTNKGELQPSPTKKVEQFTPKTAFWQKLWTRLRLSSNKLITKPPPDTPLQDTETSPSYSQAPKTALPKPHVKKEKDPHSLAIYCLGPFRVYQNDQLLTEWNGLKGPAILKYLAAQEGKPIPKYILMDVMWPDIDTESARRNLHQAIYSLRQTLRRNDSDFQHIQFHKDCYTLNPKMTLWIDFIDFKKNIQQGRNLKSSEQIAEAMTYFGIAEGIYQGDFLEEDLYEDWPRFQRENLRNLYLETANCLSAYYMQQNQYVPTMALCQKLLMIDNCYEVAHRRLMQCFLAQGQRHLAIRQYQTCVQHMKEELNITPSKEIQDFFQSFTR